MKASFAWLKQLVPHLPDDPRALADRLTAAGIEVEGITAYGQGTETCVLAWVVSTRPHPTKSGLRLVTVDRGEGSQEIVCGAPNVPEPGGVVVLAPLGAHLPAKNMTIGRRDIGGIVSEGMLCSESELGLSDESAGILVLPPGFAPPGTRLNDAIPETRDSIFEIGLTPNRPDGLGHIGLAREAAALLGVPWTRPDPEAPVRQRDGSAVDAVSIAIAARDRCAHYGASVVESVTIGASPSGIRYRLAALGVRSISTAVDVTNLVMLEFGHPLHAFDLDKVRGAALIVRRATEGEQLITLDGVTRALAADDLVIADAEGPIALAGVMGGASSEISASTTRVLLECATFDPRSVRRTARRHGLHSESSHRFERGIDHSDSRDCLAQATALTVRLCGGTALRDAAFAEGDAPAAVRVTLRAGAARRVLGIDITPAESKGTLERLGLRVVAESDEALTLEVPAHRPDLTREIDLVEELVRVRGMDTVAAELPSVRPTRPWGGREALLRRVRGAGVALGLSEALTFGFTSRASLAAMGAPEPAVALQNPLTSELDVMRTSLLPGLFEAASRARRHGEGSLALFTTGVVFLSGEGPNALPREPAMFAAVLAGEAPARLAKPRPRDVWDATGLALELVARLTREAPELLADPNAAPYLHPRGAASIHVHNTRVGVLGPIHPNVAEALDVDPRALIVEIDLDAIAAVGTRVPHYAPIPRFPASARDIALVVRDDVAAGLVLGAVREAAGPLAEGVSLFDRFTGQHVPEGHVSLALRIVYRATDRTLTDAEVDQSHARVVAAIADRFSATLRA